MSVELYLARRYLLDRRHGAWGWLISWMATGSVALGVAALIVTLAVMSGFRDDIRNKILGVQPHLFVSTITGRMDPSDPLLKEKLDGNSNVMAWAPFVSGQVLIGHGSQSSGALVKGIQAEREMKVVQVEQKLVEGTWNPVLTGKKPGIFLGQELARNIGARVGDTIWIITPGSLGLTAMSIPQAHLFIVQGRVETGLYDYDSTLAYMDIASAQKLFSMGADVSGIGVRLKNPDDSIHEESRMQKEFRGSYWVQSWLTKNQNLFSALKLEKTVMFIILILVTLVASFMIVSNLLLIITQKIKEIGILRAMGATGGTIRKTFLYQGLLMGAVGNAIGVVLGVGISILLASTNFIRLPADVYYIDRLPVKLDPLDVVSVVITAAFIVLLATLYPANRAAELDPLDAIRYG